MSRHYEARLYAVWHRDRPKLRLSVWGGNRDKALQLAAKSLGVSVDECCCYLRRPVLKMTKSLDRAARAGMSGEER